MFFFVFFWKRDGFLMVEPSTCSVIDMQGLGILEGNVLMGSLDRIVKQGGCHVTMFETIFVFVETASGGSFFPLSVSSLIVFFFIVGKQSRS